LTQSPKTPLSSAILGSSLIKGCRIGLLGGSFNPAHEGHLEISRIALKRLKLSAVWWLVSPQNPLKESAGMAPLQARLDAAQSVATDRRICVTAIESALGTQYSVDTLAALKARAPGTRFVWLMGADNLGQLPKWKRWGRIFETVPIAVFARAPYDRTALAGVAASRYRRDRCTAGSARWLADMSPPAWSFMTIRHHPASATNIRNTIDWPDKQQGRPSNTN
jgi:nicotinate-nucleotide adenylyltransferase